MKKILLVIFAAGLASFAHAQVQFGIKAGVNLANLNLSNNGLGENYKSITDFNAGLLASIKLSRIFYLQPEINYSGQGSVAPIGPNAKFEVNTQYINVPVLFKYLHKSGLFAETGPQVGFLVAADVSITDQSKYSIKSSSEPVDFSWAFGGGYKIPNLNLGVDARYNLGFTTMDKSSSSGTFKNSVFQIGFFYLFRSL